MMRNNVFVVVLLSVVALGLTEALSNPALRSKRQVALNGVAKLALKIASPSGPMSYSGVMENNLREELVMKKRLSTKVDTLTKELDDILRPATGPVAQSTHLGLEQHDDVRGNEKPYKDEKLVNLYHGKSPKNVWGGENPGR